MHAARPSCCTARADTARRSQCLAHWLRAKFGNDVLACDAADIGTCIAPAATCLRDTSYKSVFGRSNHTVRTATTSQSRRFVVIKPPRLAQVGVPDQWGPAGRSNDLLPRRVRLPTAPCRRGRGNPS
ncbi:hypothetical protein CVO74_11235 [Xanthomonas prunicola]|uniref:Uncharacterized protein n=1 Tax=Xanthomonas prunicola TaxID=2053930 RepID=A0A2N3RLK7_9XANT|nr:hypothetical protein XpruCFBP8353_09180 [Xanthomonas prunicola]PKV17652.1 hypothetical protein XpruCFBP8354_09180 [Xanthomonas prunicola]PKV21549.1 hypothetical protein CVO74_11235 [Xanthomonas prunicola]